MNFKKVVSFALDKHYPLLPGPAIVTLWKYTLCITLFSNLQMMRRNYAVCFSGVVSITSNVLLIAVNSSPVNAHLHCYIIIVITVRVVSVLLGN